MTKEASHSSVRPQVAGSLCSRFRTTKSDCALCEEVCPKQAVRLSNEGPVISEQCVGCGACYAICPTAAFDLPARADLAIIEEMRDSDDPRPEQPYAISCRRADTTAELVLPCLGRLTEALLVEPMGLGASAVEIRRPACEKCSLTKAVTSLDLVLQRARGLYEMVGLAGGQLRERRVALRAAKQSAPPDVSRRGFVGALGKGALGLASLAIPTPEAKQAQPPADFRKILAERPENRKRSALLESLKGFSPARTMAVPAQNALLADIVVSRKCSACGTCVLLCPTMAISLIEREESFCLTFRPAQCVNCRVCRQVCNQEALDFKAEATLNSLLGDREKTLLQAPQKTCPVCRGRYLGGDDMEFCPLCLDRVRKQQSMLAKLG
ncbi:MAG: hypothetical protein C4525_12320 [Desulfarculus sp.]|jgi:ferredoxin|nr:MAG: hypothetical protein C4525_12320 [Desulfarculus sp.]